MGLIMKLSGWTRVGIVASALWLVGVIGFACYEKFYGTPFGEFTFIEFIPSGPRTSEGLTPVDAVLKLGRIAWIGFLPVFLGWVGIYSVVQIARWIKQGFQQ